MKRFIKIMLITLAILIATISAITFLYMRHDRFGSLPNGERLSNMEKKSNFQNGAFDNMEFTPALSEDVSYPKMLTDFFFKSKVRNTPSEPLPVKKTDLKNIPIDSNVYVWFGHSSYFLQIDGKKILVDPVFSKYASPVRLGVKAFDHEYVYTAEDMPEIDLLIITHDHWDHLDYNTIKILKPKINHVLTGIGVGAHFEKWGFPSDNVSELYWGDQITINDLHFTSATSRHFSGRTFKRNTSLWSSFILQSKDKKIFIGGDSGFGKHFEELGLKYGPFDYAILENGQYDKNWKYIHMMPEEVTKASKLLNAKYLLPVHSSKFALANHPWDESLIRVTQSAKEENIDLVLPMIGDIVSLDSYRKFPEWWIGID